MTLKHAPSFSLKRHFVPIREGKVRVMVALLQRLGYLVDCSDGVIHNVTPPRNVSVSDWQHYWAAIPRVWKPFYSNCWQETYLVLDHEVTFSRGYASLHEAGDHNSFGSHVLVQVDGEDYKGFYSSVLESYDRQAFFKEYQTDVEVILDDLLLIYMNELIYHAVSNLPALKQVI